MSSCVLLIVVDDPEQRAAFNRLLKSTSHSLVYAADGEDGFDRFGEVKPDLVIAHVNSARLDGAILCQLIRQEARGKMTPVVLMGDEALVEEFDQAKLRSVGADAFLELPLRRDRVLGRLMPLLAFGRVLDETGLVGEAASRPPPDTAGDLDVLGSDTLSPGATDRARRASGELDRAPTPLTQALPAPGEKDMDTVVSFKNPFSRAEDRAPTPISPAGAARVDASLATESPTPAAGSSVVALLGAGLPAGGDVSRALGAPARNGGTSNITLEADEGEQAHAPPISAMAASPRDPLEEPPIHEASEPGKSRAEVLEEPLRERTPAGAPGFQDAARRGLDESQLGKRLAKRVRDTYQALDEVDYYELLGVQPGADQGALKKAYFDLSIEFHPDRFFLLRAGDLKEKIYAIFRRIHEAFRVLSDDGLREKYERARQSKQQKRAAPEIRDRAGAPRAAPLDASFGAASLEIVTSTEDAGRFVQLARASFTDGDLEGARLHLHFAKAYEKENEGIRRAIRAVAEQVHRSPRG